MGKNRTDSALISAASREINAQFKRNYLEFSLDLDVLSQTCLRNPHILWWWTTLFLSRHVGLLCRRFTMKRSISPTQAGHPEKKPTATYIAIVQVLIFAMNLVNP